MSDSARLPADPKARMGVYKHLDAVPDRYRLCHHADSYEDRNVWADFRTEYLEEQYPTAGKQFWQAAANTGRKWKRYMSNRGRHHALARPTDVEAWCKQLLADRKVRTVYSQYWVRLEEFYSWLQNSVSHPHVYHPVLMAVTAGSTAAIIWNEKLTSGNRVGGGWP